MYERFVDDEASCFENSCARKRKGGDDVAG